MSRASVLGTGLIGASVGLALAEAGWTVTGWDPSPEVVEHVAELSGFSTMAATWEEAIPAAELLVLAGPPASVPAMLTDLKTEALVTDVAGVKSAVVPAGSHLAHFVSSHPMAGREVSGPEAASPSLFRGAAWIVITDGASPVDVGRLSELVASIGANPVTMTVAEHDDAVAVVSHLPQVLAAALVGEATEHPAGLGLASGSFRDLTRVAASSPDMWAEILVGNAGPVASVIEAYAARLHRWAAAVREGSEQEVLESLRAASETRRSLAPPAVAVAVALADQPGELARVGRALESSKVDVRDLQLRHSPHGGGGILTLAVRPGEGETLRTALEAEGLLLV